MPPPPTPLPPPGPNGRRDRPFLPNRNSTDPTEGKEFLLTLTSDGPGSLGQSLETHQDPRWTDTTSSTNLVSLPLSVSRVWENRPPLIK